MGRPSFPPASRGYPAAVPISPSLGFRRSDKSHVRPPCRPGLRSCGSVARRDTRVAVANRHAMPAIYGRRDFAAAVGLASCGANLAEPYHLMGSYVARILRGEKPSDLPVAQPSKFELIINLKIAKTLGLDIPAKLLALADEVIE